MPSVVEARCAFLLSVCLVGVTSGGCMYPTPPMEWNRWRPGFPDHACKPIEEKIAAIEAHLEEKHLAPEGVLLYRRPATPIVPGDARAYPNVADTAIWTGCLLAARAFRYGVTRAAADREGLLKVLRGVRLLQEVTGTPGLLARSIALRETSFSDEKPGQEWRSGAPPHDDLRYRGDVSKDQYFGVIFGYAVTAVVAGLVTGEGDEDLRELVQPPVEAIADHIWTHGLRIVDTDGKTTRFGNVQGYILGVPIGPNAELSLAAQLLAWRIGGAPRFGDRVRDLVLRGYVDATWLNKFQILGITNHNNDVMAMMGLYTLCSLDTNAARLRRYQRSLGHLWSLVRNEGNLFYHLVIHAVGDEPLDALAVRDAWNTFRLFPVDLRLRPVDLRDHPAVEPAIYDDRKGRAMNRTALPLHVRALSSFIWKSGPFTITGNEGAVGVLSVSGVDYLLVYWMARYHGFPVRAAGPFVDLLDDLPS